MSRDDKPPSKQESTDAFLASMSFASMQRGSGGGDDGVWTDIGCDCDECGISQVPAPIQEAINRYKRQKLATGPLKRTQDRSLVKRGSQPSTLNIAVWSWTLPHNAEPLLEFGKSYRFVWVKQLPGKLYSLGQGIIGSEAEEKMRKVMSWEEGGCYFVPSTGGKAAGWVHKMTATTTTEVSKPGAKKIGESKETRGGLANLAIAKIPSDCLNAADDEDEAQEGGPWTQSLLSLCRKYENSCEEKEGHVAVSKQDSESIKKILA